jgi:DNA-binding MurR/RpiR family transcriptional regulator
MYMSKDETPAENYETTMDAEIVGDVDEEPSGLTPKQEKILQALLANPIRKDAARAAGVSEVTIWRLMKCSSFQTAYTKARRRLVRQTANELQHAVTNAVEVIVEIMNDKKAAPSVRFAAAKSVVEYSLRAVGSEELQERLGHK